MILGNATKAPELRTTQSGQNVTGFSVATNREWTDKAGQKQKIAEFHNVVAWGKLAEIVAKYLTKGAKVYVEGRLQTREWEKDGVKRYTTEIVAENVILLGTKPAGTAAAPPQGLAREEDLPADFGGSAPEIRTEDIPF